MIVILPWASLLFSASEVTTLRRYTNLFIIIIIIIIIIIKSGTGCAETTQATRYELMSVNMNWTNAHLYCSAHRMNLVVILNQLEHLALQAYLESNAG